MPVDLNTWRAKIGIFVLYSPKKRRSTNKKVAIKTHILELFLIVSTLSALNYIFVLICLDGYILSDGFILFNKMCNILTISKFLVTSSIMKVFVLCLIYMICDVAKNPGPPQKSDSLNIV